MSPFTRQHTHLMTSKLQGHCHISMLAQQIVQSYRVIVTSVCLHNRQYKVIGSLSHQYACITGSTKVLSHNQQSCKLYHTWYTSQSCFVIWLFLSMDGSCIKATTQYDMTIRSYTQLQNQLLQSYSYQTHHQFVINCYFENFLHFDCSYSSLVAVKRPQPAILLATASLN